MTKNQRLKLGFVFSPAKKGVTTTTTRYENDIEAKKSVESFLLYIVLILASFSKDIFKQKKSEMKATLCLTFFFFRVASEHTYCLF